LKKKLQQFLQAKFFILLYTNKLNHNEDIYLEISTFFFEQKTISFSYLNKS